MTKYYKRVMNEDVFTAGSGVSQFRRQWTVAEVSLAQEMKEVIEKGQALLDFCEQYDVFEWMHTADEQKVIDDFRDVLQEAKQ